jgi:curved DNA-binding protein CbpA
MDNLDRYYESLELEPGASPEQVKQAYRDLARVWHPDRFSHDARLQQRAEEKLKEINDAYEHLRSLRPNGYANRSQSRPKYQKPRPEPESTSTREHQPPSEPPGSENAAIKIARNWRALILLVSLAGVILSVVLFRQFTHSEKSSTGTAAENTNSQQKSKSAPIDPAEFTGTAVENTNSQQKAKSTPIDPAEFLGAAAENPIVSRGAFDQTT